MNLDEIIVSSLRRLDRGTDTQTIQNYRPLFTTYANTACRRIAEEYKACKKETVNLDSEHSFDVSSLSRGCYKIIKISDSEGMKEFWNEPEGSGVIVVDTKDDEVKVTYRFVPQEMSSTINEPELPEMFHELIPYYIVACERAGGDPNTQSTASIDFQIFNERLRSMCRSHLGEFRAYELQNY